MKWGHSYGGKHSKEGYFRLQGAERAAGVNSIVGVRVYMVWSDAFPSDHKDLLGRNGVPGH